MIKDGWYCCPHCGKKLFKVGTDPHAKNCYFKCKGCKKVIALNFEQ